ncbi:MAG: type III pantothenate kinase [Candidatus Omnitrophica bacterium]|nr:type III pantothenate kinase [Candidatus Omnitrophota bacterium]
MKILLAVDIGNTNITLGVFAGDVLKAKFKIPSGKQNYTSELKKIFSRYHCDSVIICSVVPAVTRSFTKNLKQFLNRKPYVLGQNCKVPIKNAYKFPRQVGQDRLVNAYAAIKIFGAPAIVIDFGTAVTFDIISSWGAYLGGMIIPGMRISLEALKEKTALLPGLKVQAPKEFIGRDTKNSILSGIVNGFGSLTDALVEKINKELKISLYVIGTGGDIDLISSYCRVIKYRDSDLTLKGLALIFKTIL